MTSMPGSITVSFSHITLRAPADPDTLEITTSDADKAALELNGFSPAKIGKALNYITMVQINSNGRSVMPEPYVHPDAYAGDSTILEGEVIATLRRVQPKTDSCPLCAKVVKLSYEFLFFDRVESVFDRTEARVELTMMDCHNIIRHHQYESQGRHIDPLLLASLLKNIW